MSNSSQLKGAERTTRLSYLRAKQEDYISILSTTENTRKETVQYWEKDTWERIELQDETLLLNGELVTDKKDTSQFIKQILRERHWTEGAINHVTDHLSPESKRDYNLGDIFRKSNLPNGSLENLSVTPGEHLKSLDNETLRTFIKARKADVDHAIFEANDRGLAVVGEGNRDPKVSTLLPPELETDHYFALLDLAEQAREFSENILSIAEKAKQFPIKDPVKNKEKAIQTRAFAQFFYGYNQRMLPSLHDLKWAFSDWEWFNTAVKEENYSKHGAAVKSKVAAVDEQGRPTGESRPLTRERVGDVKEELYKDMQDVALSMDIHAWLVGLVQWRDIEGQVSQRVADRRIRLSPKLSSTAFGADSGKEFSDE